MGLISRVSSRTYRNSKKNQQTWLSSTLKTSNTFFVFKTRTLMVTSKSPTLSLTSVVWDVFTDLVLKKAEIDRSKRAGQLNEEELERIQTTMLQPKNFKIPVWFLNRQRDFRDGKDSQLISNNLDNKLREDYDRMKKIRLHRGIRHWWGLRVKGQKTKTSGRHGRTVGVLGRKK